MARSPASRIELDVPLPSEAPMSPDLAAVLAELACAPHGGSIYLSWSFAPALLAEPRRDWLTARAEFPGFRIWKTAEPKSEA